MNTKAPIEQLPIPCLQAAVKRGMKIIVIGGDRRRREKTDWIELRTGIVVEWPDVARAGSVRKLDGVERSIQLGKVVCVFAVEGFTSHRIFIRVKARCDAYRVPCIMVHKAGLRSLHDGLLEAEKAVRARERV